jgi:hypothetical protein
LGHLPELLEEGECPSLAEGLVYDNFGSLTTETVGVQERATDGGTLLVSADRSE